MSDNISGQERADNLARHARRLCSVPLYDHRLANIFSMNETCEMFLSVTSQVDSCDYRQTLGVPLWVGRDLAIKSAQAKGWKVNGIWTRKDKAGARPCL